MDKIHRYFFPMEDDEKLNLHDKVWFFWFLGGVIIWLLYMLWRTW